MEIKNKAATRGSSGSIKEYIRDIRSKSRIKAAPEKNEDQIKKLMHNKGMIMRSRTTNWFWIYKSIIDKYGKKVGAIGIAIYCVLSRFCGRSTTIISYNTIAKILNLDKGTVIKYILLLESNGLLLKDKRVYLKGEYGSNVYYLAGGKLKNSGNGKGSESCAT